GLRGGEPGRGENLRGRRRAQGYGRENPPQSGVGKENGECLGRHRPRRLILMVSRSVQTDRRSRTSAPRSRTAAVASSSAPATTSSILSSASAFTTQRKVKVSRVRS